ncbi:hypothetical protein [Neomoorella mulderi]|uniref:Uncharacterized protein n=1 Tax=Moorella mulderi DSM 14980 TaxID=1122241 RepID=A0A151AV31_9FIRM|nr:hypothetical protein [Moorella mulderi]KYH31498.1 hypothetical protein MOMUL_22370 [Moorella mulderi DSM 14980]
MACLSYREWECLLLLTGGQLWSKRVVFSLVYAGIPGSWLANY